MNRRDADLLIVLAMVAFGVLAALALVPSSASAESYYNYTDNEDATHAQWLDAPASIGPAAVWDRQSGAINQDWWRFNASAGQLVEVKLRKYTAEPDLGFPGQSWMYWYIVYDVCGPWVSGTTVYKYETRAAQWPQQPTDHNRRDSFSFVVPENLGGNPNYFIHVYIINPQQWHVDWAFYWLNVTVTDRPSLDAQRTHSGIMEMRANQSADYNFIDAYTIDLTSSAASGDLVRAHLTKGNSDHKVYLDAWEVLAFGTYNEHLMVNRSYTATGDVDLFFTADHTGQYQIDVFRDFDNPGRTTYTLEVTVTRHALDGDDTWENGTVVTKAKTFKAVPIEMGFDNHDWWAVQMLDGDTLFKVTVTINSADVDGQAFTLFVYDQIGKIYKWTMPSWRLDGQTIAYDSTFFLPPEGTPTIFETNTTWYVRLSVDPDNCADNVTGFKTTYDIQFALSNRAPVLVVPFDDLYSWNEDETISIELASHFYDADGDRIEFYITNKTMDLMIDGPPPAYDGYFNITPKANWNGEVWWKVRANDRGYSTDSRHFILLDLKLKVLPVDDMPRSNGTITATCPEEGTASVSLTKLFYEVIMETGALEYLLPETPVAPVAVHLDAATAMVTLTPAPDVFGTFNITFGVVDGLNVPVTGVVALTVTPVNDAPRIKSALPAVEMREGDPSRELDLSAYFSDPDGDVLTYIVKVPNEVDGKLNVYNQNNVATESVIIIELLDEDFYGSVVVNVTVKDPSQTLVAQNLHINVANAPDAATLEYVPLGNPRAIKEGENTEFKVTDILDPDVGEYGLHTYTWYLDGAVIPDHNESTYTYVANFSSSGQHKVKLEVRDPAGLLASPVPEWTFEVLDVNRAPTASIREMGAVKVTDQQKVNLTVDVSDADKDALTIQWFLVGQGEEEDSLLGTGPTLNVKLPAGTQTIEVEVSDSKGGSARDSTVVTVTKTEKKVGGLSMGLIAIIVVVVLVVVIALVLVSVMGKRKKATEVKMAKMDLDSLEQMKPTPKDYGDYEEIHR